MQLAKFRDVAYESDEQRANFDNAFPWIVRNVVIPGITMLDSMYAEYQVRHDHNPSIANAHIGSNRTHAHRRCSMLLGLKSKRRCYCMGSCAVSIYRSGHRSSTMLQCQFAIYQILNLDSVWGSRSIDQCRLLLVAALARCAAAVP